jgi:hypothetical protein
MDSGDDKAQKMSLQSEQSDSQLEQYGKIEYVLGTISPVYHIKSFCDHLILAVKIATTYHDDIDEVYEKRQMSVTTMGHHTKISLEKL